jgi:hypothetical protein
MAMMATGWVFKRVSSGSSCESERVLAYAKAERIAFGLVLPRDDCETALKKGNSALHGTCSSKNELVRETGTYAKVANAFTIPFLSLFILTESV